MGKQKRKDEGNRSTARKETTDSKEMERKETEAEAEKRLVLISQVETGNGNGPLNPPLPSVLAKQY